MAASDRQHSRSEGTARLAVVAGLPGLMAISVAALSADSLALHADLILSILDMLVLVTVWLVAFYGHRHATAGGRRAVQRWEHLACTLAACCMILSMGVVGWIALARLADGGHAPSGSGLAIGLALNTVYAVVNLVLLRGWRRRYEVERTAFVRSQLCLFRDKLCTNLIVAISLSVAFCLPETWLGRNADPVAGLLIAAATARWTAPVLRDAARGMWIGWRRRRRTATTAAGA